MLIWAQPPFNADENNRRYDLYRAHGTARSVGGVEVLISRMCEFIIGHCSQRITPSIRPVEATWACIDHRQKRERNWENVINTVCVRFLTRFQSRLTVSEWRDQMFDLDMKFIGAGVWPSFPREKGQAAAWLLRTTADRWLELWNRREVLEGIQHGVARWPLLLWVYREPLTVFEAESPGVLRPRADLGPIDESILELRPRVAPPGPPTDLVASVTATGVKLRWRPSPDAEDYQVERATEGEPFYPLRTLHGAAALPAADGYCSYTDEPLPEAPAVVYRVTSSRGQIGNRNLEPTPTIRVELDSR